MATEARSKFTKTYTPGLFMVASEEFKRYGEDWRKLVTVKSTQKAKEEVAFITGLGLIPMKQEGAPITYDARIMGYSKEFVMDTWAGGVRITEEAIEDDLYNKMEGVMRDMGVSARETRQYRVASPYNTGFVTTTMTAGDNLAIYASNHVRVDGSTWSNLMTASSVNYSRLQSAILQFENQRDHRGKLIMQSPGMIICGRNLEFNFLNILRTTLGAPETAENSTNVIRAGRGQLQLVVYPYIDESATKPWFLQGPAGNVTQGIVYWNRVPVSFAREKDFDSGDAKFKVRSRDSIGVCNPINMLGNAGL